MSTPNAADVKSNIQHIIDGYTSRDGKCIPGLVYCAVRGDGNLIIQSASGTAGIACLQLVEQGKLSLDDGVQVESLAPELRRVKVLRKVQGGGYELVEKERRITLKMLLTHTAGFGYAFEDEALAGFARPAGLDDFSGEKQDTLDRPLVNQPGERFQYGTSVDWVGVLIERVVGIPLEDYFQKFILRPLGLSSISFFPSIEPKGPLAYMHQRLATGELEEIDHLYRRPVLVRNPADKQRSFCAGGHGCFGKPREFCRIIALLLNGGKDAKTGAQLLKPETVREMFRDQIPDKPRDSNEHVPVAKPWLANPTPLIPMPEDHTEGWGLTFSLSHFPSGTGRAAGSGSWEGIANLYWFADPKNNIGGIMAAQILPFGDLRVLECMERVEAELYKAHVTGCRGQTATAAADSLR